jgi:nucleoside-diphosphate-sugar epimerase
MKALVTGATGFVGSHLVEALRRHDVAVTALLRTPGKAKLLQQLEVRQVPGNLDDRAGLVEAVRGQDVVFHVAGLIAARDEAEFLRGNRDGTANLISAIKEAMAGRGKTTAPRLILVSSMAAGGPAKHGTPLLGSEPPRPVTAYGRSKLAGEEVVRASNLPWTIMRPPMVYGPRDHEVLKVFRLSRYGIAPVFGDGTQELSAVYGPDLAEALLAVAVSPAAVRKTYYPCHPEIFTSRAFVAAVGWAAVPPEKRSDRPIKVVPLPLWLARTVLSVTGAAARLAGRATILTADKANEFFQPAWTADPTPLMRDTGWQPEHDLTTGLRATASWYRDHGWL